MDDGSSSIRGMKSMRRWVGEQLSPMLTFGLEGSAPPLAPMPKLAFHLCQRAKETCQSSHSISSLQLSS